MKNIDVLLTKALKENNLEVNEIAQQKLLNFLNLMQTWNRVFNLTTITEPREMVYLHLIDSLVVQPFLHGKRMLDIGTGAGLPGIPLAIINPDQHWVLLDKNNKKIRFLTQVIAELNLKNVEALHSRSEDFQTEQCFDSILSRALGSVAMFAQVANHLLCKNGQLIAMKGKLPEDEMQDLPKNFYVKEVSRLDIKGMDIERHVICLQHQS